jgi:hypothetical protein
MHKFLFVLLLTMGFSGGALNAEVVGEQSKPILVKRKSGTVEHYVVKWTATISISHYESGSPAKPFEGHFIDDRQCHWDITSQVVRHLFITNEDGQLFEYPGFATPLNLPFQNQGSSFVILNGLRGENCNDAQGRFQSDVSNAHVAVGQVFNTVIANDFKTVLDTIKSWPNVKEVGPQASNRQASNTQASNTVPQDNRKLREAMLRLKFEEMGLVYPY